MADDGCICSVCVAERATTPPNPPPAAMFRWADLMPYPGVAADGGRGSGTMAFQYTCDHCGQPLREGDVLMRVCAHGYRVEKRSTLQEVVRAGYALDLCEACYTPYRAVAGNEPYGAGIGPGKAMP